MARTFANLPQYLVPAWLSTGEAGAKLRTWGETIDANVARLRAGVTRRFPGYAADAADDAALRLAGVSRGIPRGRTETAAHYAGRLRAWRGPNGHQLRGGAYGLIGQVLEYFGRPAGAYVQTHDVSKNFYRETSAGARVALHAITWTWGTLVASEWSRFWVLAYMPTVFSAPPELGDAALWGGALGTPGYSTGIVGLTPADVNALRRLVHGQLPWRPAGTQPEWLVVDFAGGGYDPDVYYDTWSRDDAGTRVAVRHDSCRYVSLDPEHNNTYAGDAEVWSSAVPLPSATMYEGDPDGFPAAAVLPSGEAYAGYPANFAVSTLLVDDGDQP